MISRPGRHVVRGTQLNMAKYFEKTRSMCIFSFSLYTKKEHGCSLGFQIPPSSSIEVTVDFICFSFSTVRQLDLDVLSWL